jgi:Cu2+-containing amine oxidase
VSDIAVRIARVPSRIHTLDELLGTLRQLEKVENVVCVVEDDTGIWTLHLDHATRERINWMLDRAKIMLHEAP